MKKNLRKILKKDKCPPIWCPLPLKEKEGCCVACRFYLEKKGKKSIMRYCSNENAPKKMK